MSPVLATSYRGTFFAKTLCMRKQTFSSKLMGGFFTW